jgi:acetyl-CoA acetyltransferase
MSIRGSAALVGIGETPVSRATFSENSLTVEDYVGMAVDAALKSAGIEKKDIDRQGVVVNRTSFRTGMGWGASLCERIGLSPRWQICVDHGGMNATAGIAQATLAINSGIIDLAIIVGAETPLSTGQPLPTKETDNDFHSRDFEDPFGVQGPNSKFAMVCRRHMYQYGTKFEHLGKIAITQREHACLNPLAFFYGKPITLDDYMNSRWIAHPLRLLDCVMPCNGGMAFIIASSKKAKEITDAPVYVLGFGECDNYFAGPKSTPDITMMGFGEAARRAHEMAGSKQRDMQFLQLYDDYTIAVLMTIESLGYCKVGEGGRFVEKTDLSYKGELPINTGGGQLSAGQPVGAACGGMKMYGEAFYQLRGEAGQRQIKGAKIGMCTGIGLLNYGRNVTNEGVMILGSEL